VIGIDSPAQPCDMTLFNKVGQEPGRNVLIDEVLSRNQTLMMSEYFVYFFYIGHRHLPFALILYIVVSTKASKK